MYTVDDSKREILFGFPDIEYVNTIESLEQMKKHELAKDFNFFTLINYFIDEKSYYSEEFLTYLLDNVVYFKECDLQYGKIMKFIEQLHVYDYNDLILDIANIYSTSLENDDKFKLVVDMAIDSVIYKDDLDKFNKVYRNGLIGINENYTSHYLVQCVNNNSIKIIEFIIEEFDELTDEDIEYAINIAKRKKNNNIVKLITDIVNR
jgi:hypothetical protein